MRREQSKEHIIDRVKNAIPPKHAYADNGISEGLSAAARKASLSLHGLKERVWTMYVRIISWPLIPLIIIALATALFVAPLDLKDRSLYRFVLDMLCLCSILSRSYPC